MQSHAVAMPTSYEGSCWRWSQRFTVSHRACFGAERVSKKVPEKVPGGEVEQGSEKFSNGRCLSGPYFLVVN